MVTVWLAKHRAVKRAISIIALFAFFICFTLTDAQAVVDIGKSPHEMPVAPPAYGQFANLDVNTFTVPAHLGEVQYSFKGDSDKVVVHIQDAHCNSFAQHKISGIIDYLSSEYGVRILNLEGGVGEYDLTIFTSITGGALRREVADYFVEKGEINGAEFYAINNPEKVMLWGIEDKDLYLKNLKVYRDSLRYKEEVDKHLRELTHILNNLKRHIYTPELLKMDMEYTAYKAGNKEFREYLEFVIKKAKEYAIQIKRYQNLYLLAQTMEQEDRIDFKRANTERDMLVDELKRILSKNEMRELVEKTVAFKTKRISRKVFYNFILKKAGEIGLDTSRFPALSVYIVYVATYEAVDRFKVMEELDALEAEIKELLYRNDTQRQLNTLSRNLALMKNIFAISLTKADYRYYLEEKSSFDVNNYLKFILRECPKYKIDARPDKRMSRLDDYREEIAKFYEYSFKRDEVFLKNLQFSPTAGDIESAVLMTGGFHTENLCGLFEKRGISYISVLPKFTSEEGYESPYFTLLAGETTGLRQMLKSAIAKTAMMQVASKASKAIAADVWGVDEVSAFQAEVVLRTIISERNRLFPEGVGDVTVVNEKGEVIFTTVKEGTRAARNHLIISVAEIQDMVQDFFIDPQIASAIEEGRFEVLDESHLEVPGKSHPARLDAVKFLESKAARLRDRRHIEAAEQLEKVAEELKTVQINLLRGVTGFDGHAGGMGIHINADKTLTQKQFTAVIIHEAVAGYSHFHSVSHMVEHLYLERDEASIENLVALADTGVMRPEPVWQIAKKDRWRGGRDIAQEPQFIEKVPAPIVTTVGADEISTMRASADGDFVVIFGDGPKISMTNDLLGREATTRLYIDMLISAGEKFAEAEKAEGFDPQIPKRGSDEFTFIFTTKSDGTKFTRPEIERKMANLLQTIEEEYENHKVMFLERALTESEISALERMEGVTSLDSAGTTTITYDETRRGKREITQFLDVKEHEYKTRDLRVPYLPMGVAVAKKGETVGEVRERAVKLQEDQKNRDIEEGGRIITFEEDVAGSLVAREGVEGIILPADQNRLDAIKDEIAERSENLLASLEKFEFYRELVKSTKFEDKGKLDQLHEEIEKNGCYSRDTLGLILDELLKEPSEKAGTYLIRGPPDIFYVVRCTEEGEIDLFKIVQGYIVAENSSEEFEAALENSFIESRRGKTRGRRLDERLDAGQLEYSAHDMNTVFGYDGFDEIIRMQADIIFEELRDARERDIKGRDIDRIQGKIAQEFSHGKDSFETTVQASHVSTADMKKHLTKGGNLVESMITRADELLNARYVLLDGAFTEKNNLYKDSEEYRSKDGEIKIAIKEARTHQKRRAWEELEKIRTQGDRKAKAFLDAVALKTMGIREAPAVSMAMKGEHYSEEWIKDGEEVGEIENTAQVLEFASELEGTRELIAIQTWDRGVFLEDGIGLTIDEAKELIVAALERSGGDIENLPPAIVVSILDQSPHMFEVADGFIGINRAFSTIEDERIREIILKAGLFHGFSYGLTGERGPEFEKAQLERDARLVAELLAARSAADELSVAEAIVPDSSGAYTIIDTTEPIGIEDLYAALGENLANDSFAKAVQETLPQLVAEFENKKEETRKKIEELGREDEFKGKALTGDNTFGWLQAKALEQSGQEAAVDEVEATVYVTKAKMRIRGKKDASAYRRIDDEGLPVVIPAVVDIDSDNNYRRLSEKEIADRFGLEVVKTETGTPLKVRVKKAEGHGRMFFLDQDMTVVISKSGEVKGTYFGILGKDDITDIAVEEGDRIEQGVAFEFKGVGTRGVKGFWRQLDKVAKEAMDKELFALITSEADRAGVGRRKSVRGSDGKEYSVEKENDTKYDICRYESPAWIGSEVVEGLFMGDGVRYQPGGPVEAPGGVTHRSERKAAENQGIVLKQPGTELNVISVKTVPFQAAEKEKTDVGFDKEAGDRNTLEYKKGQENLGYAYRVRLGGIERLNAADFARTEKDIEGWFKKRENLKKTINDTKEVLFYNMGKNTAAFLEAGFVFLRTELREGKDIDKYGMLADLAELQLVKIRAELEAAEMVRKEEGDSGRKMSTEEKKERREELMQKLVTQFREELIAKWLRFLIEITIALPEKERTDLMRMYLGGVFDRNLSYIEQAIEAANSAAGSVEGMPYGFKTTMENVESLSVSSITVAKVWAKEIYKVWQDYKAWKESGEAAETEVVEWKLPMGEAYPLPKRVEEIAKLQGDIAEIEGALDKLAVWKDVKPEEALEAVAGFPEALEVYAAADLIGTGRTRDGKKITTGFRVEATEGGIRVTDVTGKMIPVEVNAIGTMEPAKFASLLEERLERPNALAENEAAELRENLGKVKKVVVLEDNPDIKGSFERATDGRVTVYLSEKIIDEENPLAYMGFLHEFIESGLIALPMEFEFSGKTGIEELDELGATTLGELYAAGRLEGYRHTYARGPGGKVMTAYEDLLEEMGAEAVDAMSLKELIDEVTKRLARPSTENKMTFNEKVQAARKYEERYDRENPLGWPVSKFCFTGMQDDLDPAANYEFTAQIKYLKGDLRRGALNINILPGYNLETAHLQEKYGQETARDFRDIGINTKVGHYRSAAELKERLEKAAHTMRANPEQIPETFVLCFLEEEIETVEKFQNELRKKGEEVLAERFVIARDPYKSMAEAQRTQIPETKVIEISAQILNNKRLRDMEAPEDILKESTRNLLTFLQGQGFIDFIEGLGKMSAAELAAKMKDLFRGVISLRITRVNWKEIDDYEDSLEAVATAL